MLKYSKKRVCRRLNHDQMKLLIEGFTRPNKKLKSTAYTVATVIGFMNLTDKLLKVQSSAISSGKVGKKDPWPSEIQPHSTETIFTRKVSYSLAGCVGTSTVVLPHPKDGELIKIFFSKARPQVMWFLIPANFIMKSARP